LTVDFVTFATASVKDPDRFPSNIYFDHPVPHALFNFPLSSGGIAASMPMHVEQE
jgi:hypothetical protein